jgi:signal transduction histidine kinase
MPTAVSSEYVSLCQAQLALLLQSLGASLGAVYLAEEHQTGTARLVRVAAIPDADTVMRAEKRWLPTTATISPNPIAPVSPEFTAFRAPESSLAPEKSEEPFEEKSAIDPPLASSSAQNSTPGAWLMPTDRPIQPYQQVLPLVHETLVLGILVTERHDRAWLPSEHRQLEHIAKTLALACVIDQRAEWLRQQQIQQPILQQQQQDLFDNLLHQFRNPLTALRTFGKLLMKRMIETDANREIATSIVRESDRLQDLLKQFEAAIDSEWAGDSMATPSTPFPFSVEIIMESGATQPQTSLLPAGPLSREPLACQSWDLLSILQPLLFSAQAIAEEKQLQLQVLLPDSPVPVLAEPKALREVLSNIIDNAIKYTPVGKIQVNLRAGSSSNPGAAPDVPQSFDLPQASASVDPQPAPIQIWITDSGLGIPADDLPHLFERHYRGVQATTGIPGTGLGLAIARELLQQMHGDIHLFSPPDAAGWLGEDLPSHGTTVMILLMPAP